MSEEKEGEHRCVPYDEIDYINLVSHECKEIHATEAKEAIAAAFNNCKRLKRYHQGEPIIGTPDYQIVIYFYDGRKITLEQGGHISVLKDGKKTEYSSEIDCGRLIELIGFFAEPAFE